MAKVFYEKEGFEVSLDDTNYLLYVYAEAKYNYTPPDKENLEINYVEVSDVADMDSGEEVRDNVINKIKKLVKEKLYKMDLLNWSGQDLFKLETYMATSSIFYDHAEEAYLAGLKAARLKWHKVAEGDLPNGDEYGKNSIHRKIYLKDHCGNLYTGNYYPEDNKYHLQDCFVVEFLKCGFQGLQFCKKSQIIEWCEIPKFEEE